MARISDVKMERLKADVAVQRLFEAKGVRFERRGADLVAKCPLHPDVTPSLVVTPAKNLWRCFGCGVGGTSIDAVIKLEGVSFRHAVELLRNNAPLSAEVHASRSTIPKLPAPVARDATDAEVMRQVVDYYHQTLLASSEGLAYLEKRGLKDDETIAAHKLGFANRTLGLRLPEKSRIAGEEMRTRLQKLGVLRDSGHEHLNGCVVVPILAADGEVQGLYGRRLFLPRKDVAKHLYVPGPHGGVWNAGGLVGFTEVILCEALLDALTFWTAGLRNVTAAYGVDGFTAMHLEALKASGASRILIAFDRDDAGDRGSEAVGKKLLAEGFEVSRVLFPRGMDANEYALKVTP